MLGLKEIGGSLKILDSWDIVAKTDDKGNPQITLTLRRENGKIQTYGINEGVLRKLSMEHIQNHKLPVKAID